MDMYIEILIKENAQPCNETIYNGEIVDNFNPCLFQSKYAPLPYWNGWSVLCIEVEHPGYITRWHQCSVLYIRIECLFLREYVLSCFCTIVLRQRKWNEYYFYDNKRPSNNQSILRFILFPMYYFTKSGEWKATVSGNTVRLFCPFLSLSCFNDDPHVLKCPREKQYSADISRECNWNKKIDNGRLLTEPEGGQMTWSAREIVTIVMQYGLKLLFQQGDEGASKRIWSFVTKFADISFPVAKRRDRLISSLLVGSLHETKYEIDVNTWWIKSVAGCADLSSSIRREMIESGRFRSVLVKCGSAMKYVHYTIQLIAWMSCLQHRIIMRGKRTLCSM